MLTDSKEITPGKLTGPNKNEAVMKVVLFVEECLKLFSKKYAGSAIRNEKGLNDHLWDLLDYKAHDKPFSFAKEYMEDTTNGNSPAVDIGVIKKIDCTYMDFVEGRRKSFFSMEAKRLHKADKNRKMEYLIGREEDGKYKDCGGVERFKKGIHGRDLKYSAMIGYVQALDFNYWYQTINKWIDELIGGTIISGSSWNEKDKLDLLQKTAFTAKYQSENSRSKDSIILFHLWVQLHPSS